MTIVSVNKLDVAKQQIDAAIRLHFSGEDIVVVHTIAASANQILRDIAENKKNSQWHNEINEIIQPNMKSKIWGLMNKPFNFLKHADKDSDEILEIEENINDHTIISCCCYSVTLGLPITNEIAGFTRWYAIMYPHTLLDISNIKPFVSSNNFDCFRNLTRIEKLNYGMQLVLSISKGENM